MTKEERIQKANELMDNLRKASQEMYDFVKDCTESGLFVGSIIPRPSSSVDFEVEGIPTLYYDRMNNNGADYDSIHYWVRDKYKVDKRLSVWSWAEQYDEIKRVFEIIDKMKKDSN